VSDEWGRDLAIEQIYRQVNAPEWAAFNLDALTDVLRDLSWLPEGEVRLSVPDLLGMQDVERSWFLGLLSRIAAETQDGPRPITWLTGCS
jgi:hypothetical protein